MVSPDDRRISRLGDTLLDLSKEVPARHVPGRAGRHAFPYARLQTRGSLESRLARSQGSRREELPDISVSVGLDPHDHRARARFLARYGHTRLPRVRLRS